MDANVPAPPAVASPLAGVVHMLLSGPYRKYWVAWCVLLGLTLMMVLIQNPLVLMLGITIKATTILLVYMHLRYERVGLILSVFAGIFVTTMILYILIIPDGRAM